MSRLIAGVQSLASKVTDAAEKMHDAAGKVTAGLENTVAKVTVRTEEAAHAPVRSDRRCLDGDAGLDSSPLMVAGNGDGMQIGDVNALVQSINEALKVEIKALESEKTYHEGDPIHKCTCCRCPFRRRRVSLTASTSCAALSLSFWGFSFAEATLRRGTAGSRADGQGTGGGVLPGRREDGKAGGAARGTTSNCRAKQERGNGHDVRRCTDRSVLSHRLLAGQRGPLEARPLARLLEWQMGRRVVRS
jgi:hypothetical protein